MQAEEVAVIVSIISLAVSVIGAIWNYIHTNNLFEQSNYPKLKPELELSGGYNGTYVRLKVANTHSAASVSNVYVALEFSSKKSRLSLFPERFSVRAMPIDSIPPNVSIRTVVKDEQNPHSLKNINDILIAKFPDLFILSADKTAQTRNIDDMPGKDLPTIEQYYKVNNARKFRIKVVIAYKPDIYKGNIKKDEQIYMATPVFDPTDKYKTFIRWDIQ